MYLNGNPYEIIATQSKDDPKIALFNGRLNSQPPSRFGALIGDSVTNIRATLDYIMWELALRHFKPALDVKDTTERLAVAFLIASTPHEHHVNRLKFFAKRQVPTLAINEIKALQPYSSGNESLLLLNELANTDKHQVPLTVGSYANEISYTTDDIPPKQLDAEGRIIGEVRLPCRSTIFVTFQDVSMPQDRPVDITLERLLKTVAEAVPRFDQFFV